MSSPRTIIATVSRRVSRKIARIARREGLRLNQFLGNAGLSDAAFWQALPNVAGLQDFKKAIAAETTCSIIEHGRRAEIVSLMDQYYPQSRLQTQMAADLYAEHVFDLLGSGPVRLGQNLAWHSDFKVGFDWRRNAYYADIRPAPPPGGPDIKVPWELSRCQHFMTLGQAYWYTQDERYVQQYISQVEDWTTQNPWPWGVNWACTMDVAIRAVNWLAGYHFLKNASSLTDEFKVTLFKSVLLHGRHIRQNLENQGPLNNNHYLADLVGLVFLGLLCPFFEESLEWRQFACQELWTELFKQTLNDGASFEGSTAYHRLATELFLFAILVCHRNMLPVPEEVMGRLEKMLEYIIHYSNPDGTVPMIGDADNGRLFRLRVWDKPDREWVDHRYLLAIGAVVFDRLDFAAAAADQWHEAIWLFGRTAAKIKARVTSKGCMSGLGESAEFRQSGLFAMRHGRSCGFLLARPQDVKLARAHIHSDSLSLTLFLQGVPFFIDPGTYSYTGDYATRNLFRSTEYHNTVRVDQAEAVRFSTDDLFGTLDSPCCIVHQWHRDHDYDFLEASHSGYAYLSPPLIHCRQVLFDKKLEIWLIRDLLTGAGRHTMEWFWHCSPGITARCVGSSFMCEDRSLRSRIQVEFPGSLTPLLAVQNHWVSPSYGSRHLSPCLHITMTSDLPADLITMIVPEGVRYDINTYLDFIQQHHTNQFPSK